MVVRYRTGKILIAGNMIFLSPFPAPHIWVIKMNEYWFWVSMIVVQHQVYMQYKMTVFFVADGLKMLYFRYKIHSNDPVTLSWAFQPISYEDVMESSPAAEGEAPHSKKTKSINSLDSVAKIHALKITNTLGGGATHCQPCPKGRSING